MISFLAGWFIKDRENVSDKRVREAYGVLGSTVGLVLNTLLFLGKFLAGTISGSIAILADAFNNLSDAASSIITLVGFKLAGKKADTGHPFGHGRFEYVSGLVVAFLIVYMGIELVRSSIGKILSGEPIESSGLVVVILLVSILVKGYMAFYNFRIGKKIKSTSMHAVGIDSLSDMVATFVVLLATLVGHYTEFPLDGYCGLLVAGFILWAGIGAIRDTLNPLLGMRPDGELVEEIEQFVLSHDGIEGMHDMVIHDYGPGRMMISLHAEVPGDGDIFVLHDLIDRIETELEEKLGCEMVIHMDPIEANNRVVMNMREKIKQLVKELDPVFDIHDFRMVQGPTHTNLIFDVVIPQGYPIRDADVEEQVKRAVSQMEKNYHAIVKIEKSYV